MKKERIFALIGVVILAALLLTALLTVKTNFALKDDLNREKLTSEQLLASKLQLQKEIEKAMSEKDALQKKYMDLSSQNDKITVQLNEKERRINSLYAENSNLKKANKEFSEIKFQKEDLEKKYSELKAESDNIRNRLSEKENMILSLENQMKDLASKLQAALDAP